jgi:hypothetical protein
MYDLPLRVPGSATAVPTLRVVLPPRFPEAPPALTVFPRGAEHPRIDPLTGLVRTPLLAGWGAHDHLGRVIADARGLLVVEPPVWRG